MAVMYQEKKRWNVDKELENLLVIYICSFVMILMIKHMISFFETEFVGYLLMIASLLVLFMLLQCFGGSILLKRL